VETHLRLGDLAQLVLSVEPNRNARIVDFGGCEGYLERCLKTLGYTDVRTVNVGDELPNDIDLLIASHVLEHVYDLRGTMDRLAGSTRGKFLVDVPDANRLTGIETLPIRDYHQKHINHFTTHTMNLLFEQYGYAPIYMERYTVKSHNYPSFRVVYEYLETLDIYKTSCEKVTSEMEIKLNKLKEINYPVIVWGCGDICLHLLSKIKLDVVHYVDNDPALVGESIGGIPIYDHVESEVPIVVIAQLQRELILESIRKTGRGNRVIVI
jgi:hypothetical protein